MIYYILCLLSAKDFSMQANAVIYQSSDETSMKNGFFAFFFSPHKQEVYLKIEALDTKSNLPKSTTIWGYIKIPDRAEKCIQLLVFCLMKEEKWK